MNDVPDPQPTVPTEPSPTPLPTGFQQLAPLSITYDAVSRWIRIGIQCVVLLVLASLMFALGWFAPWLRPWLLVLAISGIVSDIVCAFVIPRLHHKHTRYAVDERGLEIRTGIFWRSIVTVARSRVQHLDVTQGPIERTYGLGRLHVHTAGTHDATVTLWGVTHEQAQALRDDLGIWSPDGDGV